MKRTVELLKLLFERSEDQDDANPVERFRRQHNDPKASKRAFREFRMKVKTRAGKTASDVHPQTGRIPESNNNWKDRLSSLILGEQDEKTNKSPYEGLEGSLRKLIRPARTPHAERSAAGARGDTERARGQRLYRDKFGGGENVAHEIPQTTKEFARSMQAPSGADARASLGAAGRRSR